MPDATLDASELMWEVFERLPDDLKAELVDGEIHVVGPSGGRPARAAKVMLLSLHAAQRAARGEAFGDNVGYRVRLPGRGSFSPDVSFHTGAEPTMKYIDGPAAFAAEVRSDGDYGPRMEAKLARKRADYFAAGTQVVWDVDLLGDDTVRAYRAARPDAPDVFRRGHTADAAPAVPGWRFPVDELFL